MVISSPEGVSVNDGISRESCSLSYARVDDIVSIIYHFGVGPGCFLDHTLPAHSFAPGLARAISSSKQWATW